MKENRPLITQQSNIAGYVRAMLDWLKAQDRRFSVRQETRRLRRLSHTLVSQIATGDRRLSLDRVPELSRLLRLTPRERAYLDQWVRWESPECRRLSTDAAVQPSTLMKRRREGGNDLFSDWLNVYIRDACGLRGFRADAAAIHRLLRGIASLRHIERSLKFLLREGYLRRTLDGRYVEHDPFVTTTDDQADLRLQAFHRQALTLARKAVGLYPIEMRRESALVIRLNRESVVELRGMLKEFYEKLLLFADRHVDEEETLYQVLINLCPIGGQIREKETGPLH